MLLAVGPEMKSSAVCDNKPDLSGSVRFLCCDCVFVALKTSAFDSAALGFQFNTHFSTKFANFEPAASCLFPKHIFRGVKTHFEVSET